MTRKKKKRPLTEREQQQAQTQYDLSNHLDSLWEKYVLTGDNAALVEYVRDGGNIDTDRNSEDSSDQIITLRDIVANLMETGLPNHRSHEITDITFYLEVELIRKEWVFSNSKADAPLNEVLASGKNHLKNEAIGLAIARMGLTGRNKEKPLSEDGGLTKYRNGKKAFKERNGYRWS